jgi:hypothetical protein
MLTDTVTTSAASREAMIRSLVKMLDCTFRSLGRKEALTQFARYFGTLDDRTLHALTDAGGSPAGEPELDLVADPEC